MLWTEFCPPSTNSCIEALVLNVMVYADRAFGKWLLLDEIICPEPSWGIYKKIHEKVSCLLCEDTTSSCLESRKRVLTRQLICQHMMLDCPSSRTVRKKFLSFKPPSLWCFVTTIWAKKLGAGVSIVHLPGRRKFKGARQPLKLLLGKKIFWLKKK